MSRSMVRLGLALVFVVGSVGLLGAVPRVSLFYLRAAETVLVERFPRARLQHGDQIAGIVVLGGHIARVREAVRLARRFPGAKLIVTGACPDELALVESEDYDASRLEIDRYARNTYENALSALRLAGMEPEQRWLLVTSATHMPRAMGTFVGQHFQVEPWPVFISHDRTGDLGPVVVHELVGLLAYRLFGYTHSFLPGHTSK